MSAKNLWIKATEYTKGIIDGAVYETNLTTPAGVKINLTITRNGRKFTAMHGMERMSERATLKDAKLDALGWYQVRAQEPLDEFTRAYIACALWSSTTDDGTPLDEDHTAEDIDAGTLAQMVSDCAEFQRANAADIDGRESSAGHDFWLTRNGHGAGFWDGDWPDAGDRLTAAAKIFGEVDIYKGDDGKLYI